MRINRLVVRTYVHTRVIITLMSSQPCLVPEHRGDPVERREERGPTIKTMVNVQCTLSIQV